MKSKKRQGRPRETVSTDLAFLFSLVRIIRRVWWHETTHPLIRATVNRR